MHSPGVCKTDQPPNKYEPKNWPLVLGPLYSGRETEMNFRANLSVLLSDSYLTELGTGNGARQK